MGRVADGFRTASSVAWWLWDRLVWLVSGEWVLTCSRRRANGGAVVLGRSVIASAAVYLIVLWIREVIDPAKSLTPDFRLIPDVLHSSLTWFGGIFAAIYFSLYARFSSQWVYLAGVYNQIKSAEVRLHEKGPTEAALLALAEWKAGFIADADELHLAGKPLFASAILAWSKDPSGKTKAAFIGPEQNTDADWARIMRVAHMAMKIDVPQQPASLPSDTLGVASSGSVPSATAGGEGES